jgi:two-component system chemotaxis sensor kinase CheA
MSTLGGGAGDDFISGFLDDYFAECEEHIVVVRRALLELEDSIGIANAESVLLEELFRSFHSLKGISAMVDLREAERLSHELESYLRALRDRELPLTQATVAVLIDGTAMLETVIEARREGGVVPSIDRIVRQLASLTAGADAGGAGGPSRRPIAVDAGSDAPLWRFFFVPSAALVERGVKVDTIRARLGAIGRIASVAPRVTPGGGIAFEFLIAGPDDESGFADWANDGLTWERAEPDRGGVPVSSEPPARTAPPVGAATESSILAPSHFVRVDLKRLDDVMRRIADLVVTRSRLEASLARVEGVIPAQEWRGLQEVGLTFERQLRDLREDVMRVRLVRVDEIFRRMPFVARDVARETGKEVRMVLSGQDTEVDKFLVERMMDPVLHLVRNAVSHGIEDPQNREAMGKPSMGVVALNAYTSGETVLIEVVDDGAGIDAASVAARARAAGTRIPDGPLDPRTLVDLICEAGFSTREAADRSSGRGMGMAVVRTTVQELGGTLSVDTEPGRGTRFIVGLPLTLAITDALIAIADGHTFAIPQSSVQEVIEIDGSTVRRLESNELVPYRGRSLPLLRLSSLLGLSGGEPARLHAFIVGIGRDAVALGVDRITGQREIVVRAMSDSLLKIEGISGATELGDGRVVLILDTAALSRRARTPRGDRASGEPAGRATAERRSLNGAPA